MIVLLIKVVINKFGLDDKFVFNRYTVVEPLELMLWGKVVFVDGVRNKCTKTNVESWEQALKSL